MDEITAKKIFENMRLSENRVIHAKTNAEFLNKVFGMQYKSWMKSRWDVPQGCGEIIVWMVRMDETYRNGWCNYDMGNLIIEKSDDSVTSYDGDDLRMYNLKTPYRIVVKIEEKFGNRQYIIKGLYKYWAKSTTKEHYFNKI